MKNLNKKGGVLQIVLLIFLSITFFLSIYIGQMCEKYDLYRNIMIMNRQKNYEILLTYYFKKTIYNDILLSDSIEIEGYNFRYEVEADYDSYLICVASDHPFFDYFFKCEIEYESLNVINFEYSNLK